MLSLRLAFPLVLALAAFAVVAWPLGAADTGATARARKFVEAHTARIRPLEITANRAWWNANLTGKDEDFKAKEEAQNKIDAALSNKLSKSSATSLRVGVIEWRIWEVGP